MIHVILPVGLLQCNCSIFGDEQTREAIVIDPGDEIEKIAAALDRHNLKVAAIVITHAHIDHVAGAHKLRALTGAPVYMSERDRELLQALDVQAQWLGTETPPQPEIDIPRKKAQCCISAKPIFKSSTRPATHKAACPYGYLRRTS